MQQPETSPHYHIAFPNPALSVPYDKCLSYAQHCLRSFPHGGLKKWTEQQKPPFSYSALVSLKRSTNRKPAPLLVQRILQAFGFRTNPVARPEGVTRTYVYEFAHESDLNNFTHQLSEFEKAKVPAEAASV